ncbi:MAG: type 1 periplasmic binding fold superfamily protein [Eudoraea sp.]|nr:type 1 periplasmic binding fold superfamily protein [Eudoraea sp.]MBT8322797.1 type 1 periplasmic binding fold superfamily protein [Eudoraea sp.]NNJ39723.1 type 1 periplasmic binding fold superfamily protein [Eudoraea sp.]
MKFYNTLKVLPLITLFFVSCSDDNDIPDPVNEEELITTMTVTLTPLGGGDIILESQDLDGDGPNAPVITVSGPLSANSTYSGTVELLNETENPAEDITEEVGEEADEHQFFYVVSGAVSGVTYTDQDGNGNPVGITFELTTSDAGAATLNVTLRHEPKKPNDGTLADAGGETDITQTFTLTVQ